MAAPLTGPWSISTPLSPASLNATTIGSGTTAERTALAAWPTGRLFFDTTLQHLFVNIGTANAPVWLSFKNMWPGTGTLGTVTVADADANFPDTLSQYRNLTVNAGRTMSATAATTVVYVQGTLRVRGILAADAVGAQGGARTADLGPSNPGDPGYTAGNPGGAGPPQFNPRPVGAGGPIHADAVTNLATMLADLSRPVGDILPYIYGGGGGSGAALQQINGRGGSGGRGAGGLIILCDTLDNTGTIRALPGAGGNPTLHGGRGGTGGGGVIVIRYNHLTSLGTIDTGAGGHEDVAQW